MIRPLCLRLWPRLQQQCCSNSTLNHLVSSLLPPASSRLRSFPTAALSPKGPLGPRIAYGTVPELIPGDNTTDFDSEEGASRNQRKRAARRAVRWGMDLASFTNRQIRFILSVASLEPEVFDAIMLVRRLGADVREGKRRQFNYIGKLLRDAEPMLMDALVHATKVGDLETLKKLAGSVTQVPEDYVVKDEEEGEGSEYEDTEEESEEHINVASRWFDGLVSKDIEVTNEVYSLSSVEFDRQELRKLIRAVHSVQDKKGSGSEENKEKLDKAEKLLNTFLVDLAKKMPFDETEG